MPQKKPRAGKKLLLATSFAIALIGGTAAWRSSINAEPQIVIPPYPKAPKPNGFNVYVKAAQMIVPANPPVDQAYDENPPADPKVRAQQYSLANKEAWLKQNAPAFNTFQSALGMKCLSPSMRENVAFSSFSKLRELARSKSIERKARQMRGDWNGAMQSRLDTVQMGNDIARGGELISALVGLSVQGIGRADVWTEIQHLDAAQARSAAKRLEEIYKRRISLAQTMRAEKAFGQLATLEMMRDSQWRDVDKWAEKNLGEKPTWNDRLRTATISKQTVINNYSQIMDAVIANSQLSYAVPQKPLPDANNPFNRDHVGTMNTRWSFARNDAANAMWLVALALHAYHLENKTYPESLRMLASSYLKEVPADPFGGGESLRYKRVGSSFQLWGVGPDKIDNNGTPILHDKNFPALGKNKLPGVSPQSKGDYVWGKNQ